MATNATSAPSAGSDRTGFWVLLATILASSMAFIDSTALNLALPRLQADLGATGAQMLWIINGYTLVLAALIMLGGSLGDHYGRKRVFMVGIGVFTLASLACGLAPTAEFLITARVLQGLGGALMVPGSLAIIAAYFPDNRRGAAIGTWSTFSTLTTVVGPILGGWLVEQGLWRAIFFINLPLAAFTFYALIRHVPESRDLRAARGLDYVGAVLATVGLAGLTYGFIQGAETSLGNPTVILALVVGVAALVGFFIYESRVANPMVPLRLFRSRTFTGTNLLTLFLYAALYGFLFFFPLNMQQVQGYPADIAGLAQLPFSVLLIVMSRWAGGLVDRVGPRLPLTVGPLLVAVGYVLFALPGVTDGPSEYWTTYFPATLALGIGMGLVVAPLSTAVMGSAPRDAAGTASGINNAVSRVAGVLAIAIMGSIALSTFTGSVMSRAESIDMPADAMDELETEARNLAGAAVPESLDEAMAQEVQAAIDQSFVDTFRLLGFIAAGLAVISAAMAFILVENRLRPVEG